MSFGPMGNRGDLPDLTSTMTAPRPVEPGAGPPVTEDPALSRWIPALGVIVVWIVIWSFTKGHNTLALPGREHTDVHQSLTEFNNKLLASRETNPVMQFTNAVSEVLRNFFDWAQRMISRPNLPRPVPEIGWLGVTAIATWVGYAIASWRIALLVLVSFLSFGIFGYWQDSMDLLIVTGMAVGITVIVGMPLAVLVGTSPRANKVITVVLDFMQTMPTFVYLVPVVLFFGIGVGGAVVATLIYAIPPIVRIAGFGIREVPTTTIEATDSAGQTYGQRLLKVQIPMARKTIIVGLNQTILAALSMATIAAYINGPGLGKPVINALVANDFGGSFVPGVLIVVMAVMLDRTTTAASERSEKVARGGGGNLRVRRIILAVSARGRPRGCVSLAPAAVPGRVPRVRRRAEGLRRRRRRDGRPRRPRRWLLRHPQGRHHRRASSTRCSHCSPNRRGGSPDSRSRPWPSSSGVCAPW